MPFYFHFRRLAIISAAALLCCATSCKDRGTLRAEIASERAQMQQMMEQQQVLEHRLDELTKSERDLVGADTLAAKTDAQRTNLAQLEAEIEVLQIEAKVAQQGQADAAQRLAEYTRQYPISP